MKKEMKKIVLMLVALLSVTGLRAQTPTTNHIEADEVTLMPGDAETQYMPLTLVGSTIYTAYNLDVEIPEGVEVALDEGDLDVYFDQTTIMPFKKGLPLHQIAASYFEEDRTLRISCVSTSLAEFTNNSGILCYVGLKAASYTKPGTLSTKLTGQNLTTKEGVKNVPADATYNNIIIGTTGYADISVSSANKWSTCVLPFATALPEGVKAYTCSTKNDEEQLFYLTEVTALDAFTPYILYSENGYTGTLTGTIDASQYPESGIVTGGYLTGAVEKQTTSEGYILQNKGGVVKFYVADPNLTYTIPAGKCWATPPTSTADSFGFAIKTPTLVGGIGENDSTTTGVCYGVNGVQLTTPADGTLYIQGGKKYVK